MEVVGALASSLQIVSQCGQVTMTIIRWVESVRTVDERINGFLQEVTTLRTTYESLSQSLKDPSILEAARITNRDVGGHLWTQVSRTLQDCEKTMLSIINVLGRIQSSSRLLKSVVKQLRESLNTGELVRLRDQVIMFNSSLQLPMQMITLTLQLRQQEMTVAHQLQINEQLTSLRRGIERVEQISRGLAVPQRSNSVGGSTLVTSLTADKLWVDNMEDYVVTAKKFLDSASVAASTLSTPSTKQYDDDTPLAGGARRGSAFVPLTQQKMKSINLYVDDLPTGSGTASPLPSDMQSETGTTHNVAYDSDDDDVDFQLLQALLQNGHAAVDKANFASAEDNYREALSLSQSNNFGSRTACSTPDITLMLSECLTRQDKYDEAITLLEPLTTQTSAESDNARSSAISDASQPLWIADKGQSLSANHLLGEIFLKKSEFAKAEIHSVKAFKGRKRHFGESHPKTIESVTLVIAMYKAKGQNARADAHKIFLKPVQTTDETQLLDLRPKPIKMPSPTPADHTNSHGETSPSRPRRPTFNFTSPFKRSERPEVPPTSIPMSRANNFSGSSSYLVADEANPLSTSPHDTSSLHISVSAKQTEKQVRKYSSNSIGSHGIGSHGYVHRWPTTASDTVDQTPTSHQRTRSSLSRAPTIYAGLAPSEMEQIFLDISNLCKDGKASKAGDKGIQFLQKYDPESMIMVHRAAELEKNIKKSKTKGLAGTGNGFAPLHFFCSMRYEPLTEIGILLQQEADPNAIAYKAGYGKVDPFTPLSLAVDRGHQNIVKMLLEKGATWDLNAITTGHRFNADRDSIHPLLQACAKGHVGIVELLLDHNMQLIEEVFPRMSWHGNSLLHEACFRCDTDMVEFLTSYARRNGAINNSGYSFIGRPGQQDTFGVTPIMYAVDLRDSTDLKFKARKLRNRIACLKLLLEEGLSIRTKDDETDGVFIDSPKINSPGRVAMDLYIEDKKGNTVFWYAQDAIGGDAELRAFLDEQSQKSRLIDFDC